MKIIHREDDTFVIIKNGNPYHIINGMEDYDDLLKSYLEKSLPFEEEPLPAPSVIDAAFLVRMERNQLLKDSDWTQTLDAPLTTEQRSLWKKYRQELRDLPEQEDFPNMVWPRKPE